VLALTAAFFFAAPLPNWWRVENVYLGQLSPTVWHNPTAIAALPLAVATFWAFLLPAARSRRHDLLVGVLLAASVAAKPNFALAFLPAATLLRLWPPRRPLARELAGIATLAAPALVLLAWQYHHALASGLEAPGRGLLGVRPLEVWSDYSPHPLASALLSLAFPLAVAQFAARSARHGRALAAAWLLTLLAVAQFALLAEPEPKLSHGNYYWAVVPALYLLFLVCACELLAERALSARGRLARLGCWALLALHAASGVWFYARPFQIAVE
jgi:hypothetical protein